MFGNTYFISWDTAIKIVTERLIVTFLYFQDDVNAAQLNHQRAPICSAILERGKLPRLRILFTMGLSNYLIENGTRGFEGIYVYLDDLEPDSGNITDGVTLSSESCDQDLVVLFDEVEAAVVGDEGGDLLAVLDQLNTDALSDGRVGLLSFDADLRRDEEIIKLLEN